jgi:hypothetical protein
MGRWVFVLVCAVTLASGSRGTAEAGGRPSAVVLDVSDGESGKFPADIYAYAADRADPAPTGTITLHDGGKAIGSYDAYNPPGAGLQNAVIGPFAAGDHTLVANYSGDDNFAPSSVTHTLHVTARPTYTEIRATSGAWRDDCPSTEPCTRRRTPKGTEEIFTASSADNSSPPNCCGPGPDSASTFSFTDNGHKIAAVPTSNRAVEWKVVLPPGSHFVTATFDGDAGYAASTSYAGVDIVVLDETETTAEASAPSSSKSSTKRHAATTSTSVKRATSRVISDSDNGFSAGAAAPAVNSTANAHGNVHLETRTSTKNPSATTVAIVGIGAGSTTLLGAGAVWRRRRRSASS